MLKFRVSQVRGRSVLFLLLCLVCFLDALTHPGLLLRAGRSA